MEVLSRRRKEVLRLRIVAGLLRPRAEALPLLIKVSDSAGFTERILHFLNTRASGLAYGLLYGSAEADAQGTIMIYVCTTNSISETISKTQLRNL